jgi:hypothetical protein
VAVTLVAGVAPLNACSNALDCHDGASKMIVESAVRLLPAAHAPARPPAIT